MARVRHREPSRIRALLKGLPARSSSMRAWVLWVVVPGSWLDSPSFVQSADVWSWETLQNVKLCRLPGCSIHVRFQWPEPMLECHVVEQRGLFRELGPSRIRALPKEVRARDSSTCASLPWVAVRILSLPASGIDRSSFVQLENCMGGRNTAEWLNWVLDFVIARKCLSLRVL